MYMHVHRSIHVYAKCTCDKELGSIYPYGLNDNIRNLGNASKKLSQGLVIYSLFNRQRRKFRNRTRRRNKNNVHNEQIKECVRELLLTYKTPSFSKSIRTYIQRLPRRKLFIVVCATEELQLSDRIPCRIALLVRDLVAYRNRVKVSINNSVDNNNKKQGFVNVLFHNKGMDMINLPSILHNKRVVASVPSYLNNVAPPIVSYTYPKTVASKVFNFKQAISNLDFELGTVTMSCNCSTSYIYAPAGHIVTGNLGIIKDKHVRKLLTKGPTYREQNKLD